MTKESGARKRAQLQNNDFHQEPIPPSPSQLFDSFLCQGFIGHLCSFSTFKLWDICQMSYKLLIYIYRNRVLVGKTMLFRLLPAGALEKCPNLI